MATLPPTGAWQVEQATESCRLWRDFGAGAEQVAFNLYAYGPDSAYLLVLTGPAVSRFSNKGLVNVTHGEDAKPELAALVTRSEGGEWVSMHTIQAGTASNLQSGHAILNEIGGRSHLPEGMTSLIIESRAGGQLTFPLASLASPLTMLRQCQDQLAASWGLDPSAVQPGATMPVPNDLDEPVRWGSWPNGSALEGATFSALMRVMVDAEGEVQSCIVQSPPMNQEEQDISCAPFVSGGRFQPGRDPAGNPVASVYHTVYHQVVVHD